MEIKKISKNNKSMNSSENDRLKCFEEFIWQKELKKILITAINSAKKRNSSLWHMLFSWQSWYWKTTLARIVANNFGVNIKIVTWYAITKPSELISILNNLDKNDILFIDEIHRIKPNVEEVLYTAMEDFCIDMVMPEGGNVRVSLNPFTLIWATTKLESITQPLKNRFVYNFHLKNYSEEEKIQIIKKYTQNLWISVDSKTIQKVSTKVENTPRNIKNFCIKLRDYLVCCNNNLENVLTEKWWEDFIKWWDLQDWGIQEIHRQYLQILRQYWNQPVGLKTISVKMWLNEKAVEQDIEPLLLKLGKVDKTNRWRVLTDDW